MTRKGKLMNLRQMKIKTVRVNIKQEEKKRDWFLAISHWMDTFPSWYTVSTCPWLLFLFFCQLDLPVKGNKENKFKNWLKYNNECLIAFCTDRVQVPDPLQYSNDCIRNAPKRDLGNWGRIGKGCLEKVGTEACLMRNAQINWENGKTSIWLADFTKFHGARTH